MDDASQAAMTPDEMARACADAMWADDQASQAIGVRLVDIGPGRCIAEMPVRADMIQGHGTCHGGYIFTLADTAFAFACNSYNQRCVAQHASVTFLASPRMGDVLTARAEEISRSGRSGIYDIHVSDQNGLKIAEFRGHSRTVKGEFFPGARAAE